MVLLIASHQCLIIEQIYQPNISTYIHAYTYMHTYVHTCIHTYIYTYIPTYIPTYIHTYTHTYIYTYVHIFIHISYIHIYYLRILIVMNNFIRRSNTLGSVNCGETRKSKMHCFINDNKDRSHVTYLIVLHI